MSGTLHHTVSSYVFIYLHPKLTSTYSFLLPHYIKWLHLCNKSQSVGCGVIFIRLHADGWATSHLMCLFVRLTQRFRERRLVTLQYSACNRYTRPSVEWSTTLFAQWLSLRNNAHRAVISPKTAGTELYALVVCIKWINVIALLRFIASVDDITVIDRLREHRISPLCYLIYVYGVQ